MHSQLLRRAVVALAAASLTIAGSPAVAGAAGADPASGRQNPSHADHGRATGWYLALGDSLAAGLQPGVGEDRAGGYVGAVLDAVRTTRPKTRLVNLACSGETSTTLVDGGLCSYHKGSQLAEAEHFLHAHGRKTRLVTLTIGSNDVTPCLRGPAAELGACVQQALGVLADNLKRTLAEVRAEAPQARLVVTNYYNPYLALWFDNPWARQRDHGATTAAQRHDRRSHHRVRWGDSRRRRSVSVLRRNAARRRRTHQRRGDLRRHVHVRDRQHPPERRGVCADRIRGARQAVTTAF